MAVQVLKASDAKKKLKVMCYGTWGTGKTLFALGFPSPLVVDMEGGADLYGGQFKFDVVRTRSVADVVEVLDMVRKDGGKRWKTLVIDPVTVLYESLLTAHQANAERRILNYNANPKNRDRQKPLEDAALAPRDWNRLKRRLYDMLIEATNANVHLVLTAHAKDVTETKTVFGEVVSEVVGHRPDFDRGGGYYPDVVLFFYMEGVKFMARAEKGRAGIVQTGQIIQNPSFSLFQPFLEQTGSDTADQTTEAPHVTADSQQRDLDLVAGDDAPTPAVANASKVNRLVELAGLLKVRKETWLNTLGEYGATNEGELSAKDLAALLERMETAYQKVLDTAQ